MSIAPEHGPALGARTAWRRGSQAPRTVDFAVVAILRETYEALGQLLSLSFEVRNGYEWAWGELPVRAGGHVTLATGFPLDRENVAAGQFIDSMLRAWNPRNVLLVDIGGGVLGRDGLQLGDVVVHTVLHYYDYSKEAVESEPRFLPLPGASTRLRELSRRPRNRSDDSWIGEIPLERPTTGAPTVLEGEFLVGGAILAKGPKLDKLLAQYKKALVIEMEAVGVGRAVLDSGLRGQQPEYLAIRGISDYCNAEQGENQATRESWRAYAAAVAATHSVALMREAEPSRLSRVPARVVGPVGRRSFALRASLDGRDYYAEELGELALARCRVALVGRAGAGKTVVAEEVARSGRAGTATACVPLKSWTPTMSEKLSKVDLDSPRSEWKQALDVVLEAATTDVTADQVEKVAASGRVLLVVDGLNSVSSPTAMRIVNAVDQAVRRLEGALAVLVTDRTGSRYDASNKWVEAILLPVDPNLAARLLDEEHGEGTWHRIPERAKRLLVSPFFLDLALKGADPASATRSAALNAFITKQAGLDDETVEATVRATVEAYQDRRRVLRRLTLDKALDAVAEAGIVAPSTAEPGEVEFAHELFGDYFASLHLAGRRGEWQPGGLDTLTFSAERWRFDGLSAAPENFEPVTLAAEQIESVTAGDLYLRAVYDWNWRAAVDCLAATDPTDGPFSEASRLAVLALLSERRLDPVDGTCHRANALLGRLVEPDAGRLRGVSATEARRVIEEREAAAPWFERWKRVYCRRADDPWDDSELHGIASEDALHGWTVSYVLKRAPLGDEVRSALKGIYIGAAADAPADNALRYSVRWRVVHALGVAPSEDSLRFLLKVLDTDPYPWVRWGAGRSLMEVAACSSSHELTAATVDALRDRAAKLPDSVAMEIAWVAQYRGAGPHFPRLVRPLLEALAASSSGALAEERWQGWLNRFDEFWNQHPER